MNKITMKVIKFY